MLTVVFLIVVGLILWVAMLSVVSGSGRMSQEEVRFANEARKLLSSGLDAKTSRTVEGKLAQYEAMYSELSSRRSLVSDHIYQQDMRDLREHYEDLAKEEWEDKADRILDKFYNLYDMITDPTFKDVEKAYRSKKQCIGYWQQFFLSIPSETGIWYDAKNYMKKYLDENYDDCMYSHETLEKKLDQCIEEMKPEYRRKRKLRDDIIDVVAKSESIMRSQLYSTPFEGSTAQEVRYCVNELVEKYRLVELKIGNRYFVSLSDKEKEKRAPRSAAPGGPEPPGQETDAPKQDMQ